MDVLVGGWVFGYPNTHPPTNTSTHTPTYTSNTHTPTYTSTQTPTHPHSHFVIQLESHYKIRAEQEVVHEVIERIYHFRSSGLLQQEQSFPTTKFLKDLLTIEEYSDGSFKWMTKSTKKQLLRTQKTAKGYFNYYSMSGPYTSTFDTKRSTQAPVWRVCNSSSTRNSKFGREGILYHFFELGPFYILIKPTNVRKSKAITMLMKTKGLNS